VRHKREQLVHVDATLAILDPDADPSEIKPKRIVKHVNLFRSGELSRLIMTAFRESDGQPMSNRAITEAVMRLHGIGPEARRAIQTRVSDVSGVSGEAREGREVEGDRADSAMEVNVTPHMPRCFG
jgi:hypothetical protein